jgi:hypothetical protein
LNLRAAELDPSNLGYRLNTAAILQEEDHLTDALSVLRSAEKLAKTADDLSLVQGRIKTLEQYQAQKDQVAKAGSPEAGAPPAAVVQAPQPRHPDESADGPRHTAQGVIRNVQCTGATEIELKVEEAGKSVVLYSNNYYQLGFRATNYTPEGEIHPCTDLEGMKASIQYAESSDKTVNGQIVSVELSK